MAAIKAEISFSKLEKPFKGFVSTWTTHRQFSHKDFKKVLAEFKKIPILVNIQYVKVKYKSTNVISVSFKSEEDEAAFILLTAGSGVEIDADDEWFSYW